MKYRSCTVKLTGETVTGFARVSAHISDFPLTTTEYPKDALGNPDQAEISGV